MTNMFFDLRVRSICSLGILFTVARLPAASDATHAVQTDWTMFASPESNAIALPVKVPVNKAVFTNAMLAVIVDSITSDGQLIAPEGKGGNLRYIDPEAIPAPSTGLLYWLPYRAFNTLLEYDAKTGAYLAVLYFVPVSTKTLLVRYRVRFPDNKISAQLSVNIIWRE